MSKLTIAILIVVAAALVCLALTTPKPPPLTSDPVVQAFERSHAGRLPEGYENLNDDQKHDSAVSTVEEEERKGLRSRSAVLDLGTLRFNGGVSRRAIPQHAYTGLAWCFKYEPPASTCFDRTFPDLIVLKRDQGRVLLEPGDTTGVVIRALQGNGDEMFQRAAVFGSLTVELPEQGKIKLSLRMFYAK
ncbi:MAG: hypothetical protein NTZ65_04920 [Candidatus Berkelbacteria bacterium]|nr:hypothetical protein [Candidatus Berkelbacteria bacterium]